MYDPPFFLVWLKSDFWMCEIYVKVFSFMNSCMGDLNRYSLYGQATGMQSSLQGILDPLR